MKASAISASDSPDFLAPAAPFCLLDMWVAPVLRFFEEEDGRRVNYNGLMRENIGNARRRVWVVYYYLQRTYLREAWRVLFDEFLASLMSQFKC